VDPLSTLLHLPASEKLQRGVLHTPQEIAQQPATWRRTFELLQSRRNQTETFLAASGIRDDVSCRPIVFLVGVSLAHDMSGGISK
jgi:tagatose-6-phosphate ketose/aldose isomerase